MGHNPTFFWVWDNLPHLRKRSIQWAMHRGVARATRVIPKKLTGAINTLTSDTERKRVWAKLRQDKTGPRGDEIPIPMPHDN